MKEWDVLFSDGAPNAQATFEIDGKRELVTFEMFKPKLRDSNQKLSFKIDGIGEKNKDLLTGLKNKRLSDASLFIDDGTIGDTTVTMKVWNDSGLNFLMQSLSTDTVLGDPSNVSGYTDEELDEETIYFIGGEDGAEGVIEVPVTLKNGLREPSVSVRLNPAVPVEGSDGQCNSSPHSKNGLTTVYYSIDGGATRSTTIDGGGKVIDSCPSDTTSGDTTSGDTSSTMKVWNDSGLSMQMESGSPSTVFGNPRNVSGYTDAEHYGGIISFTGGENGAEGVFEIPVTLKNGQGLQLSASIQYVKARDDTSTNDLPNITVGQCDESSEYSINGPTTVYYSIDGGVTQSVEATC